MRISKNKSGAIVIKTRKDAALVVVNLRRDSERFEFEIVPVELGKRPVILQVWLTGTGGDPVGYVEQTSHICKGRAR